jgi:hypothetical protein
MDRILKMTKPDLETNIERYLQTLTDMEKKVFIIAKEHLESSFSIENSTGFIKWVRENVPATE